MFRFFKKTAVTAVEEKSPVHEVLALTIGRTVEIDALAYRFWPEDGLVKIDVPSWLIVAQGHVDLGEGSFLHRFYPSDDNSILQLQGGDGEGAEIDEIIVWTYHHEIYPSGDAEWNKIAKSIRAPKFHLENTKAVYSRAWFNEHEEDVDPISYWETVYENRTGTKKRRIFQTAMLFARTLSDGEDEMLLVNMEEPENGDKMVCFMTGRQLTAQHLAT